MQSWDYTRQVATIDVADFKMWWVILVKYFSLKGGQIGFNFLVCLKTISQVPSTISIFSKFQTIWSLKKIYKIILISGSSKANLTVKLLQVLRLFWLNRLAVPPSLPPQKWITPSIFFFDVSYDFEQQIFGYFDGSDSLPPPLQVWTPP